jgi:serine/threonine protein kinase
VHDDDLVDTDPLIGAEIAGFRIESVLGRGAMGVVYVAHQRSPDRRVALKLIAPAFAGDETFRLRFLRETAAAAAIEHPHVLPVYAAGDDDGTLYLAMRLADGRDLRAVLSEAAGLPVGYATNVVRQIGEALDTAHARGLVHRDVKPGNILVARPPEYEHGVSCYLTDFGVSTWTSSTAATITATGKMVGTADYVAPEQIEGGQVDGRADQYSLGCVLYECLTGRPPFGGRTPVATLYGHLHEEPPPPSTIRTDLPSEVDTVAARALRKDPSERYASCVELAEDLRRAVSGASSTELTDLPVPTDVVSPSPRHRRRWVGVAVVLASVLLVGGGVVGILATVDRDPATIGPPVESEDLIRDGIEVTASDTAPASTDGAGNPVTYLPSNVIDGDVETAWRTPGDGLGEHVTLLFDTPVDLTRIGLIPGYAKTDPETGVDRFFQHRIITEVRYLIPGVHPKTQTFRPEPVPQSVHLRVTTSRVTVVITGTSEPGGLDYTAISEIYVYGTRP